MRKWKRRGIDYEYHYSFVIIFFRFFALPRFNLHVNTHTHTCVYICPAIDAHLLYTSRKTRHPTNRLLSLTSIFLYNSCYRLSKITVHHNITIFFIVVGVSLLTMICVILPFAVHSFSRSILYILFFVVLLRAVCINWVSAPLASHC